MPCYFSANIPFQAKKDKVVSLRELNSEAEKTKSFGEFITEDFQRRYENRGIGFT